MRLISPLGHTAKIKRANISYAKKKIYAKISQSMVHYIDVCQCDVSHPMTHCFHYVSSNESCATNLSVEDEVARGLLTLQVTHFPILRILTKKRREYTSYLHTSCYSTGFHI